MLTRHICILFIFASHNQTNRLLRKTKSNLSYPLDNDDDDIEEASDAVVPDGVEEVELAKIGVELKERARKLLLDDIRALSTGVESSHDQSPSPKADDATWIVTGSRLILVCSSTMLISIFSSLLSIKITLFVRTIFLTKLHLVVHT